MMNDKQPVITFKNVSKEYYLYKSNRSRFIAIFTNNRGVKHHSALQNINVTINQGEAVGVIGKNGAGKSTLLKLITGVSFPTVGDITIKGKVAAMLELTAGFSPELTGRQNIYLKGYLLGLDNAKIGALENKIIEFAELDEYIDQPIRTYSSGMKMRLGFAININIDPDILVIDEALSVGDAEFREKCEDRIRELIQNGVTVLFVSHSVSSVKGICSRVIYLEKGQIVFDGDVDEALTLYNQKRKKKSTKKEK